MTNKQYFEIYVKEPNHVLYINNKVVRTPLKATVNLKQLNLIKVMLYSEGISRYSIREINKSNTGNQKSEKMIDIIIEDIKVNEHDVIVEEL
jgi:hypothetical protein